MASTGAKRRCLASIRPPIAAKQSHIHKFGQAIHNHNSNNDSTAPSTGTLPIKFQVEREDQYHWLRDDSRSRLDVLAHLKQENVYYEAVCEATGIKDLAEVLYTETLAHYKEDAVSVPEPDGEWFYYKRMIKDKGYPVYCRRPRIRAKSKDGLTETNAGKETATATPTTMSDDDDLESLPKFEYSDETGRVGGPEEVLFDVNLMAEGVENYYFLNYEPSPDQKMFAYAADTSGNEICDIRVRLPGLIDGKQELEDIIQNTSGRFEWDSTGQHVFYVVPDSVHRTCQVFVHRLGTPQTEDVCLFEDPDQEFEVDIAKSADKIFLKFITESKETSETHLLNLQDFAKVFGSGDVCLKKAKEYVKVAAKRIPGHRYDLDHWNGFFYIVTNKDGSVESKLSFVPVGDVQDLSKWTDVFSYDSKVNLTSIQCFQKRVVVGGRFEGSTQIWIVDAEELSGSPSRKLEPMLSHPLVFQLPMEGSCYCCELEGNHEFETPILRYTYESLTTPKQTIEFNMNTKKEAIVYMVEVPMFNKDNYCERRIMVPSGDGAVDIPLSIVWSRQHYPNGVDSLSSPVPLILHGYGSYGVCIDPAFRFQRLPVLDRGIIYAFAHIRGGGEMGWSWYQTQGKFLNKKNTFYDFIACAEYLHHQGMTSPQKTAVLGRSAGGLLIGASVNVRPDLFSAVIADVPFVDCLNTMADSSIPLTTQEWKEWGNPHLRMFYYYMLEYSPYDNVRSQRYPPMYFTSGLHDPRVGYWEPAKFVAKLREFKTDDNVIVLHTSMNAGHNAAADRYKSFREQAREQAFIMWALNVEAKSEE